MKKSYIFLKRPEKKGDMMTLLFFTNVQGQDQETGIHDNGLKMFTTITAYVLTNNILYDKYFIQVMLKLGKYSLKWQKNPGMNTKILILFGVHVQVLNYWHYQVSNVI